MPTRTAFPRSLLRLSPVLLGLAVAVAAESVFPLPDGQLKLRAGADWQPFSTQPAFGVRSVLVRNLRDPRVRGQIDAFGTTYEAKAARVPAGGDETLIRRHCVELLRAVKLGASSAKLVLKRRPGLPTACELASRRGTTSTRQVIFLTRAPETGSQRVVAHSAIWTYPTAEEVKWQPQLEALSRSLLESGATFAI